jgi:hypothetical protein
VSRAASAAAATVLALAGFTAQAGEIYVEGRVLDVAPMYASRTVIVPRADCPSTPRPAPDLGLLALLQWDLEPGCTTARRTEQTITGYQVRYEWDDRVYSRIMTEPPGETVTLRLKVR